jgi:hypothetical protein
MRQAYDEFGPHFPSPIADQITVELHDAANYGTIAYTAYNVNLSQSGTATVNVPSIYSGSYYISIKHRNSIETTSAVAISFAGSTITMSFGTPADVYGGNLVQMTDLTYAIYGGDVNQDGIADSGDLIPVDNDAANFTIGYTNSDCNGDGIVNSADIILISNSSNGFIRKIFP